MRRLSALLITVLLVCAGCTKDGDGTPTPSVASTPATTSAQKVTSDSLGIDWPTTASADWPKHPAAPEGFNAQVDAMAKILVDWGATAATDAKVWHGKDAVTLVADSLPSATGKTLEAQVKDAVSPRLAVANVFADNVTIVGTPRITAAWRITSSSDDVGRAIVRLELQTRTAYEVHIAGGPARVIGVLRVHGLSAYADTANDYGVTGGWQEFGAGDCSLATDDALLPDSDAAEASKDLATFIRVAKGSKFDMPPLGVDEQVDSEYLKRCRAGSV